MAAIPIENGVKIFQAYQAVRPPKAGMGYDSVVLWLFLAGVQDVLSVKGDILEIGVRYGGGALLELMMLRPDERAYLIDIERTSEFDRRLGMLEPAQQQRMDFFVMPSDSPRLELLHERKYRWIHINAYQEYSYVKRDIERFADSLAEDGILVVDDFFQFASPDVTTATYEFLAARPDWKILFIGFNKAYLVHASAKPRFMAVIEKGMEAYFDTFGKFQGSTAVPMAGDLVCMVKGFPTNMVDRAAKRAGKDLEAGERRSKRQPQPVPVEAEA